MDELARFRRAPIQLLERIVVHEEANPEMLLKSREFLEKMYKNPVNSYWLLVEFCRVMKYCFSKDMGSMLAEYVVTTSHSHLFADLKVLVTKNPEEDCLELEELLEKHRHTHSKPMHFECYHCILANVLSEYYEKLQIAWMLELSMDMGHPTLYKLVRHAAICKNPRCSYVKCGCARTKTLIAHIKTCHDQNCSCSLLPTGVRFQRKICPDAPRVQKYEVSEVMFEEFENNGAFFTADEWDAYNASNGSSSDSSFSDSVVI